MTNQDAIFAEEFALNTSQSFFLTGKAGTGKTTLLRNILQKTTKNTVVVAPTGVAAINAGGVTIHSMFSLPLTSFIPNNDFVDLNVANNRTSLKKHMRYRKEKRKLLQELELLIIDEISMVRADLLDAIEFVLQQVRHNEEPFGGLQVVFIGDLFQLPPVVREDSWNFLREYYDSPFFFDSQAWKNANAFTIELKHIYRQQDEEFINILNHVRNGEVDEYDLDVLNKNYNKNSDIQADEFITLCTHNYQADNINKAELEKLRTREFSFKAKIEGTFNENAFPADLDITIKEGAQIMFVRNDAEDGMYFNGKLAKVISLGAGSIKVEFLEDGKEYSLKEEIWENINYTLDKETNEVKQEKLGSFKQYPIRLAWAITVHKSQGLTFKKAILDLGKTFAAGQAYVALSRCTDLNGMVLKSKISAKNIFVDPRIVAFHNDTDTTSNYDHALKFAKEDYAQKVIYRAFSFSHFKDEINDWKEVVNIKDIPEKHKAVILTKEAHNVWLNIQNVEQGFKKQLHEIFKNFNPEKDLNKLDDRAQKAIHYFSEEIFNKLIQPLNEHINEYAFKSKTKAYVKICNEILQSFWLKMHELYNLHYLDHKIFKLDQIRDKKDLKNVDKVVQTNQKKGATYEITLEMFKSGKIIEKIAEERNMAKSTIEQHISKLIKEGKINVFDVLDKEKVAQLEVYLANNTSNSLTDVLELIPFKTDFAELRFVTSHIEFNKKA